MWRYSAGTYYTSFQLIQISSILEHGKIWGILVIIWQFSNACDTRARSGTYDTGAAEYPVALSCLINCLIRPQSLQLTNTSTYIGRSPEGAAS